MARLLAALGALLALLAAAAPAPAAAQAAGGTGGGPPAFTPSPGQVSVRSGQELLQALQSGTGDITLTGPITLSPDVWAQFQLPIVIQPNSSVLVHRIDPSSIGLRQERIDWGGAMDLIEVSASGALKLEGIISEHPGNFTQGLREVHLKVNGSFLWPTITGWPGSSLIVANSTISNDDPGCSPETTQAAVLRVRSFLPPELAGAMKYEGGTTVSYTYLPYPSPVYNVTSRTVLGTANFTLMSVINTCFDSLAPPGASSGSGGGTPDWVWAVVGAVVGCVALTAVGGAFLWWRARARRAPQSQAEASEAAAGAAAAAVAASEETKESLNDVEAGGDGAGDGDGDGGGGGKQGGGGEAGPAGSQQALSRSSLLPSLGSFMGSQAVASGSGGPGSGDLHAVLMRTRFGVVEDLQLGELLGRGAFGRVYKGRWKGALVAVKVIEHTVQPGKTHDLSREPLLSMSISHPNIIATHQVMVLRLLSKEGDEAVLEALAAGGDDVGSGGGGGGRRMQAPGSAGLVEAVSPTDVLQPGLYETWLVEEYCDRGNLADLISAGKHIPPDPSQHHAWALLCLLDISIGLHYLHRAGIVHGDLKPHNVMLKSTRTDRRGFTCKLIDFGLSRALGGEQTHVQTKSYGTASYAAPELLTQGKLSSASDIYSLALILWQLSCTAELHEGMSAMQIIVQVSQHGYRPEVPEGCPQGLIDLMQRCWQEDPTQRPAAGQVVEELREQLSALPQAGPKPRPAAQLASPPAPAGGHPAPAAC